jgi:hypothetical protein
VSDVLAQEEAGDQVVDVAGLARVGAEGKGVEALFVCFFLSGGAV